MEYSPALQSKQVASLIAAVAVLNLPEVQPVHAESSTAAKALVRYFPGGHWVHEDCEESANSPVPHEEQACDSSAVAE